ncbi:hypothetical protein HCN44_000721 [Aphidius gifuensis]|uniref:W2 domain-containing protein n=1 Tax=Aphidius gifuensis TaxID=684658 RepID=A0A834XUA4_APHGI|nr:hypothetical protein HCN44_000721 [Aphidius gifuensis]
MKKSRYENLWALPPVKLSEKNTQQFITGGFKRKLMDNDSNLPTIQNKRLCVVETSTSVEINQPRPRCTRPPKIYGLEKKSLDRSLHKQNDSHQYDKAKNGWKPTAGLQINNITADYETQALYKKISCILNKVTAENMDKLIQQVRDLNINFHERLEGFVDLIFDKAVDEPYFAAICAMMCKKLVDLQVDVVDMRQGNKTNFRSLLLTRSENAGIPTPRLPVSNETNDSPIQAFHEKVRDILNKLTQANIDGSTQQIKLLGINTHEKLKSVVDLVFEKVINEPNFEAVCAALCVYMRNRLRDEQIVGDDIKQNNNKEQEKGVLKMKATNNVNEPTELPTEINKQPYPIATSTSMEANQQTSIALPRSNNTGATTIYISHNKTFDMYRDLPQSPEPETPTRDQSMSMSLPSEGQSIQLPGSSCTNAPINYRSDDKTLDMYSDSPQSPEPETTSQSSTSLIYVIYSHLDEQIKTLINVAIEEFKNKIDHLDYPVFIRRSLEVTMLESSNVREKYWGFVANMITDNVFPLAVFQSEYDKMFEEINDVSPIFWTYKAEILRILVMCGAHPLKELKRTTSVLKKKGLVGNLVGELLKILVASEGQISITDKWHNSGIEWNDLFDTSLEDPDDIIKKYNLQFLTFRVTDPPNEHLLKLLRDSDIDNTLKWIAVNVGEEISRTPKFVRILFTLLLESGIETKYSFYKRNFYQPNRFKIINLLPLIKDYIDGNLESELQCLYALTDVNHRCKNPPGFAYDIIKELHEKDIISLGAFYVWHNGTAATSELIGHDEAKWNLLSQSFWIKYQNSHY